MQRPINPAPQTAEMVGEMHFSEYPLAMAYVVMQRFTDLSSPEEGLRQGTVFNDLVKPLECGLRRRPIR